MPIVRVKLSQGKFAFIDSEDEPLILGYRWIAVRVPSKNTERWYAATTVDRKRVYMHRLLMGFPDAKIDHRNGDGLDNRRSENLRIATNSGNSANAKSRSKSGFRGVYWDSHKQAWTIEVWSSHRKLFTKRSGFRSAESAARAYDHFARRCHGEFARLNFPSDEAVAA